MRCRAEFETLQTAHLRPAAATLAALLKVCAIVACALALSARAADFVRSGGPYVPTPQAVVDEMLNVARVTRDDVVIDLGSGDGRIVLTAAARFQARGEGVEIDPELVAQSSSEAQKRALAPLAQFRQEDALKARIDHASVLTLYLLPHLMHQLRDRIYAELRPGSRVVSHDFRFNDWAPDRTVTIDVAEKYGSAGKWQSTIYLWIVPAKISGRWSASVAGEQGEPYVFSFVQTFQRVEGEALVNGERLAMEGARLEGKHLRFLLPGADGESGSRREFTGIIEGDTIDGTIVSRDGSLPWRATRRPAPVARR